MFAGIALAPISASAHDKLLGSDPVDGSIVDAFPATLSLEFSDKPIDVGATVAVLDAEGRDYAGDLTFDGNVVTAQLGDAPTGANYQVQWRVISSDGHAISGAFEFGVGDTSGAEEISAGELVEAQTPAPQQAAGSAGGAWRAATFAAVGAVVLLGLGAAIVRLRNRTSPR